MEYPAKLILLGEYTIIDGGDALAIPYNRFSGSWKKANDNSDLLEFFGYLKGVEGVNLNVLEEAISEKWTFESNIPRGYGAGSSGALTAAAYDSFFDKVESKLEFIQKKLGLIESFFHGRSSGLDPLVSFNKKAIYQNQSSIELVQELSIPKGFYIFDSQKHREAKPLIDFYLSNRSTQPFINAINRINEINAQLINTILQKSDHSIKELMKELSHLQLAFMDRMIPDNIKEIWCQGLEQDSYYMKLCGAGGGGFFIIYSTENVLDKIEKTEPLDYIES